MAYNELIKNFEKVRAYMREFYVYGFKSRTEYDAKSARSYDDERRRLESWLGDYMRFVQTPEGKNVFLSVDSRVTRKNPFYKAWKAKSFTDGDITLHFAIFDILFVTSAPSTLFPDIYVYNFVSSRRNVPLYIFEPYFVFKVSATSFTAFVLIPLPSS